MAIEYDRLHEYTRNEYEKYDSDQGIKLEDFVVQTQDFLDSKAGISLISDDKLAQDVLLENIKVESSNEQLRGDIGNTENSEFELGKIETIKVETCIKNENVATLQEFPPLEGNQTCVSLNVKKEFVSKANSTHSTRRKGNSDVIFCKECNKTFNYRYYYKIHARVHAGNTPYKCDICEKCFVKPSLLKTHKVAHSESKPYSCKICGRDFKWKRDFTRHESVHSGNRPFPCDQCNKSFQDNTKLKAHKETHVSCEQCGKSFDGKIKLYQHTKSVHLIKEVHICSYCGKTFSQKNSMMSHVRIHTAEKPFSCEVCKKSFTWDSSLQIHMRVHTGECPYSCEMCSAKFKCSQNLKRHMKVHIKKKLQWIEKC